MRRNNILNLRNLDRFLFSDEEMNPRQNAYRDEVLSAFTPLANSLVMKILEAGDSYLEIAEYHPIARQENTFPSSILHGFIIEKLSEVEGVLLTKSNKRNTIIEIGLYKVWVKKLDERGMPWVNDTKSSVKRILQKAEGEDVMPVLILGYKLNQIEHISQVTLSYMKGDQHLWAPIDLGEIAANNYTASMVVPVTEEPIITIKPGKQRDKEKTAL